MSRIDKKCPGDCSKCQMAQDGEVNMIPCILDQIFQGQQRIERKLDALLKGSESLATTIEETIGAVDLKLNSVLDSVFEEKLADTQTE